MDEASSFFQEIKGQDVKHDSNIGLLNQLFDGEGDKSTFAGMRQRFVPPNSTSMTLGVQPQLFFHAIVAIGKTVWQDSGFTEWFLFTTVRPYRYVYVCSQPFIIFFFLPNIEIFNGNIQYKSSTIFFLNLIYKYSVQIFKRNIQVIFFQ